MAQLLKEKPFMHQHDMKAADLEKPACPRFQDLIIGGDPAPVTPRLTCESVRTGFNTIELRFASANIWSFPMTKPTNRIPPALKHGCYSSLSVLPTEDRAEFDKLHHDLIDEYRPTGRSEDMIVSNLAAFIWRRQNLATYALAQSGRNAHSSIYFKLNPPIKRDQAPLLRPWPSMFEEETRSPEVLRALRKEADQQAQRELGPVLDLANVGDVATPEHLEKELAVLERLDGMIAKCLKQLLLIRGVKLISPSASAESTQPRIKKAS